MENEEATQEDGTHTRRPSLHVHNHIDDDRHSTVRNDNPVHVFSVKEHQRDIWELAVRLTLLMIMVPTPITVPLAVAIATGTTLSKKT